VAKQSKAVNAFAREAMKAEVEKTERGRRKYGVFNQMVVDTIKDTESKAEVQQRYNEYIMAVDTFNKIRDDLTRSKFDFQNIIDNALFGGGLVSKSKLWEIYKVDDSGNVYYRDSEANFLTKFAEWFKQDIANVSATQSSKLPNWDWLDRDIQALKGGDTENGTEGTANVPNAESTEDTGEQGDAFPQDLEGNEKAYLTAYRALQTMDEMYSFYRSQLNNTERPAFYKLLRKGEQKNLYDRMDDDEQSEISHLR
jgi:hypothetical protein